jgi:hypothetical protein
VHRTALKQHSAEIQEKTMYGPKVAGPYLYHARAMFCNDYFIDSGLIISREKRHSRFSFGLLFTLFAISIPAYLKLEIAHCFFQNDEFIDLVYREIANKQ